jgi:hypothetical protein
MANINAHQPKQTPVATTSYQGEIEHLMEKVKWVYSLPISSLEGEVEKEKQIAQIFARKREIEINN